ncbi:MAG: hypothetical protein F4X76_12720 [Chloroflexi bacterium]|nr:hypothetical protein [Chloroflexota bacterium]
MVQRLTGPLRGHRSLSRTTSIRQRSALATAGWRAAPAPPHPRPLPPGERGPDGRSPSFRRKPESRRTGPHARPREPRWRDDTPARAPSPSALSRGERGPDRRSPSFRRKPESRRARPPAPPREPRRRDDTPARRPHPPPSPAGRGDRIRPR